jgi:hypothetical protein
MEPNVSIGHSHFAPNRESQERIARCGDHEYVRRDGVPYVRLRGMLEWGDSIDQHVENWAHAPEVAALFTELKRAR